MMWTKHISNFSRYNNQHTELLQSIDSHTYLNDFSQRTRYLQEFSNFQLRIDYNDLDINKLLNQYPDIAVSHWNTELIQALENSNADRALHAIKELKILCFFNIQ